MRYESSDYRSGPIVWAAIVGSTCLLLYLFQKALWLVVPFILALIIYYALLPIKLRLVLAGFSHASATGLVSAGASLVILLLLTLILPRWLAEAGDWQETASRYLEGGVGFLLSTLRRLEHSFNLLAHARLSDQLAGQIAETSDDFARKYLASIAMTVAAWAPSLLLALFLAFFMLRDGWRFKRFLGQAVPNAFFERSLYLLDQVDRTARLYFLGLMELTVLDTLCLASGLWLLGVSGPLLLGLATAVLAWIPYIGSVLGCILVVLVAATDFPGEPMVAYGAIALFLVVRLLDDFVFMPLTIGRTLKMHPLLTVLMIFVGGAVAGVPGLMLVLPVLGVMMVLGETIGMVVTDPRLQARHAHARRLRERAVTEDLSA